MCEESQEKEAEQSASNQGAQLKPHPDFIALLKHIGRCYAKAVLLQQEGEDDGK